MAGTDRGGALDLQYQVFEYHYRCNLIIGFKRSYPLLESEFRRFAAPARCTLLDMSDVELGLGPADPVGRV